MNLNSLNRAFTKRLRLFIAILTGGLLIVAAGQPGASATISIVDSLGSATPTTTFASSTTGGLSISSSISGAEIYSYTNHNPYRDRRLRKQLPRLHRRRAAMSENSHRTDPSGDKRCSRSLHHFRVLCFVAGQ